MRFLQQTYTGVGVLLLIVFAAPAFVYANGQTGLTVSPVNQELSVKPGEAVTAYMKVTNPTDEVINITASSRDFRAQNQTGQPSFYTATDGNQSFALSSWISFPQSSFALAPHDIHTFAYTVTIPKNAEAGGHYGAVFLANKDQTNQEPVTSSQVAVKSMVGTLILATVSGDVTESAKLASFSSSRQFYADGPINFSVVLQNTGNVHIEPFGDVIIKDWHGETVTSIPINPTQGSILPQSSREFAITWSPSQLHTGHYTAELALYYGKNQPITAQITFWAIPARILETGTALLLLIIVILYLKPRVSIQLGRKPKR